MRTVSGQEVSISKTIEEANEHVSRYLSHSLDEDSYYRD